MLLNRLKLENRLKNL